MNLKLELIALSAIVASTASAGTIIGNVTDSITGEPLIGVTIITKGKSYGTVTDIDGNYKLTVPDGTYDIVAHYTGYKNITFTDTKIKGPDKTINFRLSPDNKMLGEVTVTARARFDTDLSQIREQKHSFLVQSGVSAQQISRTQDKDASEVIKRVPGISIIDDKFIMVRGLSQRYNNVWLNGSAVPSSEADSRSFSFDILPSSQLDNIVIVKSPAPEYPADFTGGFVLVNTKQQPENDRFDISLGLGMNTTTHFRKFLEAKGGKTDFLGFDNGFRSLTAGMDKALKTYPGTNKIDPLANGLNNDWTVKNNHPIGDIKLNMSYNHLWKNDEGRAIGLIGAINYSNTYKTYTNMENSLYGPYDTTNDKPVFLRKATDNQYNNDVRLGALLNLSLQPSNSNHLYEWKNIFNQLGKERYSTRSGFNAQPDNINDDEYFYSSRTTYNTQFTGRHDFNGHKVNWNVGYAYANRNMPDRRLIERTDRTDQKMGIYRISREFSKLDEHIASIGANYEKEMKADRISPKFKAGIYGEYRTRNYRTRRLSVRDPRLADTSQSNGFESDNNASGAETTPFTTATFKNITFIGPMTAKNSDFQNTNDYINGGNIFPNNGSKLGKFQAAMQIRRSSKLNVENSLAVGYPIGLIVDGEKGNTVNFAKNGEFKLKNIVFAGMGVIGTDKNKEYEDYLFDYSTKTEDRNQKSFSHTFFLSESSNKVMTEQELGLTDPMRTGQNYCPSTEISDGIGGYIGAFRNASDNWLEGWTNFDPQNAVY